MFFLFFIPKPGEMIQFDLRIFSNGLGWFNHQLVFLAWDSNKPSFPSVTGGATTKDYPICFL